MAQAPETLDRAQIEALIPHAGTMCLLDRVHEWNEDIIECRTGSHRRPDNPLRFDDRLPVEAGVEYAAQAMAVHGGLHDAQHGRRDADAAPRHGFVAVLNRVAWSVDRLDTVAGELTVTAEARHGGDDGRQYAFHVLADGRELLWGEALVVLASA